jgi:hypothetical protein
LSDKLHHADGMVAIMRQIRGREERFAQLHREVRPRDVAVCGGFYVQPDAQSRIWLDAADMKTLAQCGVGWGLDLFVAES